MIAAIALLLYLPLLVVDGVFLAEVLLGLRRAKAPPLAGAAPRIALVIPAHNEAGVVGGCVAAMLARAPAGTRALVVAHNCSDGTAEEARAAGAEILVLDEPTRRGKGYALAGGAEHLRADPPEVVIAIDADCVPEGEAFARLAARALAAGTAIQAAYLFRAPAGTPAPVRVSTFAILVKNLVRQRGSMRLGGPALLTGSGMAFPWPLFGSLELATGNIVEDLALGVALVKAGRPPLFEPHALVTSTPSNEAGTQTQRARWEGGFLRTGLASGTRLAAQGLARARWPLLWMGLHLLTPPLTLLLLLNGAAVILFALLALLHVGVGGLLLALAATVALVLAVLAAWWAEGRAVLPGAMLARLPLYFLWKLALYVRIVRGREAPAWIRTERVG